MADTENYRQAPGQGPSGSLASSPNFLRSAHPATAPSRYADANGLDEYDHQVQSHRLELDDLDLQITNLDRTIELEQEKLRESQAALDEKYHVRNRLLRLRAAMLKFVLELEARDRE